MEPVRFSSNGSHMTGHESSFALPLERDRSRAGSGPISVRSTTDLGEIGRAEDQAALVALGAQASPRAVSDNPASTPSGLTSTTTS